MSGRRTRALLVAACAVACAVALAPIGAAAGPLESLVGGGLVLDVRSSSGELLGSIRANVSAAGRGLGSFRPGVDRQGSPLVVGIRGSLGDGGARLALRARTLRATVRVDAGGSARGSGTLAGEPVVLDGVASDARPSTRKGMEILVVGKPSGEAWQALKAFFRPVAFDPAVHTRAALRDDRARFHRFAGVVFGAVSGVAIREHALLRDFVDAGKWVIVAPATEARLDALAGVHPYDPNRDAAAVAIRSTGPTGGLDRVKPTVVYPEIATAARTLHAVAPLPSAQRRAAAKRRQAWFVGQLVRLGTGQLSTARTTAGTRTPQTSSFSLPYNAAAIELAVPYYHEVALTGSAVAGHLDGCGWNQQSGDAWCPGTTLYQQYADPAAACAGFRGQGLYVLPNAVREKLGFDLLNSRGAYTVEPGTVATDSWSIGGGSEDACPQAGTQTAVVQGNDYYYAIYDPSLGQHTLVAVTDPTVSATISGELWRNDAANGTVTYHSYATGVTRSVGFQETAWFLGSYVHQLVLSGANVGPLNFEYSGSQSYPNNAIGVAELSTGTSVTKSVSVGVFGTSGTYTYSDTVTQDASVAIQAPDWAVSPSPVGRGITYTWETQTDGSGTGAALDFETISAFAADGCCDEYGSFAGAGLPFDPNDVSIADFGPASLTVWSGAPTYGPVTVTSTRTLSLVDHFAFWNLALARLVDDVEVVHETFGDDPNGITPITTNAAGPGIDLCDPAVMAPQFQDECAASSSSSS